MKTCYFLFFLIGISLCAAAQDVASKGCDLFGPLHFKNGMATVTIKAFDVDLLEDAPNYWAKMLSKKEKVKYSVFYNYISKKHNSGAAIAFIADGCNKVQYASLARNASFLNSYLCKTLELTLLVFERVPEIIHGQNFVITGVKINKADNKSTPSIKTLQYFERLVDTVEYSYFGINGESMRKGKATMLIDEKQTAYIKLESGSVLSFKRSERTLTETGYIDHYTGTEGYIELNINRIVSELNKSSFRFGHLTVKLKNADLSIDVFGEDREKDKFNGY